MDRRDMWGRAGAAIAGLILAFLASALAPQTSRIAVISDTNGSYGSTRHSKTVHAAIDRIIALKPDLVIATGDLIAGQRARPKLTRRELRAMWAAFDAAVTDRLKRAGIPLVVTPGNHDASVYPAYTHERSMFQEVWKNRRPPLDYVDVSGFPFRFAFRMNGALFVSLDVTRPGKFDPEQTRWLKRMLAKSTRRDTVVLFSHLPLFPFAQHRETEIIGDMHLFEMLKQADVDLYLSGHHHAYYPGVKGKVLFNGQSCLGSGARKLIGDRQVARKSFTWVEIDEAGKIDEYALAAPDFRRKIPLSSLPRKVGVGQMMMTRRDLIPWQ